MSKKFSNYTNQNLNNFVNSNKEYIDNYINNNTNEFNHINNLINQYSGMSTDEMFDQFIKMVEYKKRNGTLSVEGFANMRNQLFPYLTDEQKQIFNNLINYIR